MNKTTQITLKELQKEDNKLNLTILINSIAHKRTKFSESHPIKSHKTFQEKETSRFTSGDVIVDNNLHVLSLTVYWNSRGVVPWPSCFRIHVHDLSVSFILEQES